MRNLDRSKARQWSHAAWAIAAVFGSLPIAGRILLGNWGFEEAWEFACALLVVGAYFHLLGRRAQRAMPDPAIVMDRAIRLASEGRVDDAIALLTKTIRLNPRLWQALQYRGELYLMQDRADSALRDFDAAILLAGDEKHLYLLREKALIHTGPAGETGPEAAR